VPRLVRHDAMRWLLARSPLQPIVAKNQHSKIIIKLSCVLLYQFNFKCKERQSNLLVEGGKSKSAFCSMSIVVFRARICKSFKEPRNRFPARRADTTTLFEVSGPLATLAGGIDSL
jgi:hypothetical protein